MKTVRLEFLRHGPPHNQLLSPLTEYMALCENHQAATVQLPFEHAEFLIRLQRLQNRARHGPAQHDLDHEDVARPMTALLAQVPGLIRELANSSNTEQTFHLRMILSANELALLPFEMANAPAGFAGDGEPLLLQSEPRVCITREARRVADADVMWLPKEKKGKQEKRKILFAAAGPPGTIPMRAHLLALRQVIQPWMEYSDNDAERRKRVAEHLTVLSQATLAEIESECASGQYSHVHILAHGASTGADRRFGLYLHDRTDREREVVVDGSCLAKAIRSPSTSGAPGLARPVVVTLAACDSGNVGSVVGAGASIAHALHYEGIPLVIASQFPLSFAGSVIMTRMLYEGLLWGQDPREMLVNLRRKLKTLAPHTDWASIVAYAAFPSDLEEQLGRMRMYQALRSLEVARSNADRILSKGQNKSELSAERQPELEAEQKRLGDARERIERELNAEGHPHTEEYGRLASSDKRLAEVLWRMAQSSQKSLADVRDTLIRSREYYRKAFRGDNSKAWALVQSLILTAVLQGWDQNERITPDQWQFGRITSEEELKESSAHRRAWAHSNLIELYLLAPMIAGLAIGDDEALLQRHTGEFLSVTEPMSDERTDTSRQLLRYGTFFAKINQSLAAFVPNANEIAQLLADPLRRT